MFNDTKEANCSNLVILPGGGNPDTSPLYSKVYSVICREARKYGYRDVDCRIRWSGHFATDNYETSHSLGMQSAVDVALKNILSTGNDSYTLLARSFGCIVALKLAQSALLEKKAPAKIILWGPPPYWLFWQLFVRDITSNQLHAKKKGLKIDETFHYTIEPIESMIQDVSVSTVIVTGTEDPYCTPAHLEYLRAIASKNSYVIFKMPVDGASHEVTDDDTPEIVKQYAQALFD